MAIVTGVLIAGLAVAGFVYGKVRSRVPAEVRPRPPTSESVVAAETTEPQPITMPPPTPLPPPSANPLPPPEPITEWAPPTSPADSER